MRTSFGAGALCLALMIGSIPAAEGVFRAIGDQTSLDLAGLYAPFEDGSYKLAPAVNTGAHWSAGRFTVHTDILGLRTDALGRFDTGPGERVDVILIGDSQGFGNGLDFNDSLAGRIAEAAAREGRRIANASVGGHGLRNQLRLVQWLRSVHRVSAASYVLLATPVMISNARAFARATVGSDGRLYQKPLGQIGRVASWLKTHSVVYTRVRGAVRNMGVGARPDAASTMVFEIYRPVALPDHVADEFLSAVKAFQGFASQDGADLYIVYVPLTVEIDSANLQAASRTRGIELDMETPMRRCQAIASRLGIPVIDLRPVLRQLHEQGRPLSLLADFHYNAELSRRAAASLWPQLEPLLPANHMESRSQR